MSSISRVSRLASVLVLALGAGTHAGAGTVTVKVEMPKEAVPPPAPKARGYLERANNPLAPPRGMPIAPYVVVVLEGESAKPANNPQVTWELVGESFARPVLGVAVGSEVVIKNVSKTARSLSIVEDAKLMPPGPLNPTGVKSFRVTEPKTYSVVDKDTPHLKGSIVVVASSHVGHLDAANKVELADVPEGTYKARIYYRNAWVGEKPVTVPTKGKVEVVFEKAVLEAAVAPAKK